MFLFCSRSCAYIDRMARSSTALRQPQRTAVLCRRIRRRRRTLDMSDVGMLAGRIDSARRRGRGTLSNASGRYEPTARIAFDDGWQSLEELPRVFHHREHRLDAQDHHPQPVARHSLRSLDQSLSRLRARLRLLLRAADPRLPRSLARPRFRIEAVRQTRRAGVAGKGIVRARIFAAHHRDRHQHRSLPADRTQISGHARHSRSARARRPSGRHRHQIGARAARPRYPGAHGRTQSGQGRDLGHHARSQARARHGTARADAHAPARSLAPIVGRGRADHGDGGAHHSRRSTTPRSSASSMPRRLPASKARAM